MEPFLKWAGGKRWLANRRIISLTPSSRWIEPFAGSAAMFFALEPNSAVLGDTNWDLINTYRAVRDNLSLFVQHLHSLKKRTTPEDYYSIRSNVPTSNIAKAARFVYLNRLAWNGLYRVNKKGEFNVPKGTKTSVILPTDNWSKTSELLQRVELRHGDFENIISNSGKNDTLFVDPPYTVAHNNNGFLKYNETIFSWEDQKRLRNSLKDAASRGANIIITNADHASILELYAGEKIKNLSRASIIAGKSTARGTTSEALILIPPATSQGRAIGH